MLALLRAEHRRPRAASSGAIERGSAGSRGCRLDDGGWGAFDADNTRPVMRELPFCDFGEVIDPPSADVTAHVVEMLAALGAPDSADAQRACAG